MRPLVLALSSLLVLAPGAARAGAFYVADVGTRGLARAGAFVAAPDSLLALHYNPAGLSLLSGMHLEADLSLVAMDFTFNRKCPCVDPTKVENAAELDRDLEQRFAANPATTNALHRIPYIAIGYGLPFYDLTIAFAGYGPVSGKYEFGLLPPSTAPNFEEAARRKPSRYSALTADTLEVNLALGFGLQPLDGVRVGGSVMVYQNANDQYLDLWVNSATFASEPEQPGFDVPMLLHFERNFALNWALGAIVEPLPGLSVGASFRGKRSIRADGTIDVDLPQTLRDFGAMVTGREIEIEINTAPIARLGVEYAVPRVFRAEAAFVYEGWSTYDRIVIRPKNVEFAVETGGVRMVQPLPTITQPRKWEDTFSLRFGGELNLLEPLVGLRAGYFYEPRSIPPEQLDTSRMDSNKHGFSLGASTTFYGVTLELAAMYIALETVEVTQSEVKITAPLTPPLGSDELVTTVGNGTYAASYLIFSGSLSFALDPLLAM